MISIRKNKKRTRARVLRFKLTGNDEASLRGGQSSFTCEPVLRAALIRLVSIFGPDVPDVQLAGRQHQIFSICEPAQNQQISHTRGTLVRSHNNRDNRTILNV